MNNKWLQFSQYLAPVKEFCSFPGQCVAGYMEWFYRISHQFMNSPQLKEPPRHPLMVHDDTYNIPYPLVLPIHTVAMPQPPAPVAVDANIPQHAVV